MKRVRSGQNVVKGVKVVKIDANLVPHTFICPIITFDEAFFRSNIFIMSKIIIFKLGSHWLLLLQHLSLGSFIIRSAQIPYPDYLSSFSGINQILDISLNKLLFASRPFLIICK